jgi:hypothetical protein
LARLRLDCGEKGGPPSVLPAMLPLLRTLALPANATVRSIGHYPLLERLEVLPETHALLWQKNVSLFSSYPMLSHFDVYGFRFLTVANLESAIQHVPRLEILGIRGPTGSRARCAADKVRRWIHTKKDKSAYVAFDLLYEYSSTLEAK